MEKITRLNQCVRTTVNNSRLNILVAYCLYVSATCHVANMQDFSKNREGISYEIQ